MTSEMDQRADLPARTPPAERPVEIDPPAPGVPVLACRCGAVLDLADMCREPIGCRTATVARITCWRCAA